jgi:antitoxin ParD1/3/4
LTAIPIFGIFAIKNNMSKNTSVTLGDHFEQIIEKSIQSGRYSSASEVIREGLRLVDEREQKIRILQEAIEAGERSGYVKDFDPIKHLEELNQSYKK